MIVKDNNKKRFSFLSQISESIKFYPGSIPRLVPAFYSLKKIVTIILLTVIVWSFLFSVVIYRKSHTPGFEELALALNLKGRDFKHKTSESFKTIAIAPFRWLRAKLSGDEVPQFNIDIKFKNLQKLIAKREQALESGVLVKGEDDYVPAEIRFQGETYKIKMRLKGDWTDHLEGDKWSFRIHVKGGNHLLGMSRFSVQHPRTRNFESEILFFEALKKEGILVPRYFFVEVSVNGKNIGLMALEEHFSKELLEAQRRREGVIVRFDEDMFWASTIFDNYKIAKVTPFRSGKVKRSSKLSADLAIAKSLLKGFVRGHRKPSEVFDPDLMGKFIAVADVWGSNHVLRWHNMRFYFNPITALLEPIGFDAHLHEEEIDVPHALEEPIVSAILEGDPVIKLIYQRTIERLANEMEEENTEKWFRTLAQKQLRILHKEFPSLNGFRFERIARRAREVLSLSQPPTGNYPELLQVKYIQGKEGRYLELLNPLPQALEVKDIFCVDKNKEKIKLKLTSSINFPLGLSPTLLMDFPKIKKIPFELTDTNFKCEIALEVKVLGAEKLRLVWAELGTPDFKTPILPTYNLQETLAFHTFLKYSEDDKKLQVLPGDWRVSEWIVVPELLRLEIPKGTTLRFDKTVGLLAKGPVLITGTEKEPVVLTGSIPFSKEDTWPGIALLKASKPSDWAFVRIENTSGVKKGEWELTGGVNFYEAEIKMNHVAFLGNRAEDALNIVRSKFELKSVRIKNTTSDAFDSDFSQGTIENSVFENIGSKGGGDGIDVSGSEVRVKETYFINISDKALSVGENSHMKASGVNIENVSIGAASKDGSRLLLSNSKMTGIKKAGLMAYIKKTEYGPAEITVEGLEYNSKTKKAISQKGNKIIIGGKEIQANDLNVQELYASGDKP
jgi:hypothetical protein